MESLPPNIFHAIVFDLHPKIREYIDRLDKEGQIDHDDSNSPHIIAVNSIAPSVYKCDLVRNGLPANFVLHTRKKGEPILSWNKNDNYKRVEQKGKTFKKERDLRTYENIVESILSNRRK